MFSGKFNDFFENISTIDAAGGVIWIDDDDGARFIINEGFHLLDIGFPIIIFIEFIISSFDIKTRCNCCILGICRGRHQDILAGISESGNCEVDAFASAVTGVTSDDILYILTISGVIFDSFHGLWDAFARSVTIFTVLDSPDCGFASFGGEVEIVGIWVSDIQINNAFSLSL